MEIKDREMINLNHVFNSVPNSDHLIFEVNKDFKDVYILDPGLNHVVMCKSNISKIDGNKGKLFYRDKSIEQIIGEDHDFIDVAVDLIVGENKGIQFQNNFRSDVINYFELFPELKLTLDPLSSNIHPMDFLAIGIMSLSSIEDKYLNKHNDLIEKSKFIIAQTSVIAVYYLLKQQDKQWISAKDENSFASLILSNMFYWKENYNLTELAKMFNKILILHAEHELNCSTATVRNIASAGGDIYCAIASGICAFKGRLHGGASQYVSEMYEELFLSEIDIDVYITNKITNKERLMGFGHRVYNCWDPRAKIMLGMLNSIKSDLDKSIPYKAYALKIISRVESDEYFQKRNIFPNPDLLNCIFYKMIGVPSNMNTVMLTTCRVVGWLAHYIEHLNDKLPIIRPRQIPR